MVIFLDRCIHTLAAGTTDAEISNACVAARSITGWFDALERAKRFLTDEEKVTLHKLGLKFVSTLDRLAIIALRSGSNRWKLQPKIHTLIHVCEDHLWYGYNARFLHCYVDEDFMGLTKRLALKCHRGELLEFRVMCRFLLRLASWIPGTSWENHIILNNAFQSHCEIQPKPFAACSRVAMTMQSRMVLKQNAAGYGDWGPISISIQILPFVGKHQNYKCINIALRRLDLGVCWAESWQPQMLSYRTNFRSSGYIYIYIY